MDITIKNYQLQSALRITTRLATEKLDISIGIKWSAVKVSQKLEELLQLLGKAELALIKEYAVLDEQGNPVPAIEDGKPKPNTWTFKDASAANKEEFVQKHNELFNAENKIQGEPVALSKLDKTGFTGIDLLAIEMFIDPEA